MGLGAGDASRTNMKLGAVAAIPNVELGAVASRPNVGLGGDASRPNMGLGVVASSPSWDWAWTRPGPTWSWSRSRSDPTWGWVGTCPGPTWSWPRSRPFPMWGWGWAGTCPGPTWRWSRSRPDPTWGWAGTCPGQYVVGCCDVAIVQINYPSLKQNTQDSIEQIRGRSHEEGSSHIFMLDDMQLGRVWTLSKLKQKKTKNYQAKLNKIRKLSREQTLVTSKRLLTEIRTDHGNETSIYILNIYLFLTLVS